MFINYQSAYFSNNLYSNYDPKIRCLVISLKLNNHKLKKCLLSPLATSKRAHTNNLWIFKNNWFINSCDSFFHCQNTLDKVSILKMNSWMKPPVFVGDEVLHEKWGYRGAWKIGKIATNCFFLSDFDENFMVVFIFMIPNIP